MIFRSVKSRDKINGSKINVRTRNFLTEQRQQKWKEMEAPNSQRMDETACLAITRYTACEMWEEIEP
jgi:hypothetical protein